MAMMEVKWIGPSAYRVLTGSDFRQHGIENVTLQRRPTNWERSFVAQSGTDVNLDDSLLWGPHNGQSLVLDVTPELEQFFRREKQFALVSLDDNGRPKETVVEPTKEEAQTVTGVVVYAEEGKPEQRVQQSGDQRDLPEA